MFREFEKEAENKTPDVLFCGWSLRAKKAENNTQENLLAMFD